MSDKLRTLLGELYQVLGVLGAPANVLDQVSAGTAGKPLPHDTLLPFAAPDSAPPTNDQIKHMVNRFLCWRLPENFNPDGGISFKKIRNENSQYSQYLAKNEPVGTNLFDATQAEEMVRYMVEGLDSAPGQEALDEADWAAKTPVPPGNGDYQLGFLHGQNASQQAIRALLRSRREKGS